MNRRQSLQSAAVAALLGLAAFLVYHRFLGRPDPGELGFFYDVSARRIFTAARTTPPPIRGVDGPEEDAFRAVVISTNGHPADRRSWRVAYLERFSPELQQRMRAAQASGNALEMGRLESQSHRFVRRLDDTTWHSLDSPDAEAILNSWAQPGPERVYARPLHSLSSGALPAAG